MRPSHSSGASTIEAAPGVRQRSTSGPVVLRRTVSSPVSTQIAPSVSSSRMVRPCRLVSSPAQTRKYARSPSIGRERRAVRVGQRHQAVDDPAHDCVDLAGERGDFELAGRCSARSRDQPQSERRRDRLRSGRGAEPATGFSEVRTHRLGADTESTCRSPRAAGPPRAARARPAPAASASRARSAGFARRGSTYEPPAAPASSARTRSASGASLSTRARRRRRATSAASRSSASAV